MTLIVDASVATKWILPEPGSDAATALRATDGDIIAPALVCAEIGNAIWKAARRGDLAGQDVGHLLDIAVGHYARLTSIENIAPDAMRLAVELDHPIYDCFYLALAERERAPLITADRRLLAAAKRAKGITVKALA